MNFKVVEDDNATHKSNCNVAFVICAAVLSFFLFGNNAVTGLKEFPTSLPLCWMGNSSRLTIGWIVFVVCHRRSVQPFVN